MLIDDAQFVDNESDDGSDTQDEFTLAPEADMAMVVGTQSAPVEFFECGA